LSRVFDRHSIQIRIARHSTLSCIDRPSRDKPHVRGLYLPLSCAMGSASTLRRASLREVHPRSECDPTRRPP
jgi:hypothetical protein